MHVPDHCKENLSQSCARFYDYRHGYFGKPTKLRTSQPSMFEILTWNEQETNITDNQRLRGCQCYCHCACNQQNLLSPQKQICYVGQNVNSPQKNLKQFEQSKNPNKKVIQNQKGTQQKNSRNIIQGNRYPINDGNNRQNNLLRPKSAGNIHKTVKLLTSPIKNDRLAPEPLEYQEQPMQVKEKLIQKFKQTTRWIPNSSFTTYFGKPAFENYGRCNINPASGGLMYGNYLKTHNIQPHRGINSPKSIQTYNVALLKAQQAGPIYPYPPKISRKHSNQRDRDDTVQMSKSQIYPESNNVNSLPIHAPQLYNLQKFGGKGIKKQVRSRFDREKQNQYNMRSQEDKNQGKSGVQSSKRFLH